MIEGLKLRVTASELRIHLNERSSYHKGRAETKAKELVELRAIAERLKTSLTPESLSTMTKISNSSSYSMDPNDACESLERDVRTHNNKALMFSFFAEHLFDEDYTLSSSDLMTIEVLRDR